MNIKEMENLTGLKKANIRFYEEKGLLEPQRNEANNYREYSEEDAETLNKIKLLRTLGISICDIRRFQEKKVSLSDLMEHRFGELEEELRQVTKLHELCRNLVGQDVTFGELDITLLHQDALFFRKRGEMIMKQDREKRIEQYREFVKILLVIAAATWGLVFLVVKLVMHSEVPGVLLGIHLGIILLLQLLYCWLANQV